MQYESVIENDLKISLDDGKKIHGVLRGELTDSCRVVVIMHGFPGSAKNLLSYLGSRYLAMHGFTTLALSMYDVGDDYRNAYDASLNMHVSDFHQVVSYLHSKNVAKICAVGHSFGGLTIIKSDVAIDAAVLWDPSHGLAWQNGDVKHHWDMKNDEVVISTQGRGSMRPARLQHELEQLGDTSPWAAHISYPTKIITGDKSVIYPFVPKYMDYLAGKKHLTVIEGASHSFDEQDHVTQKLFAETLDWLQDNA